MTRSGRAFTVAVLVVAAMLLSAGIDHRAALSPTAAASTYTDLDGCADSTAIDVTPVSATRTRLAVAPDPAPSGSLAPVLHPGSTSAGPPGPALGVSCARSVVLRV